MWANEKFNISNWHFVVILSAPYQHIRTQLSKTRGKVQHHFLDFIAWRDKKATNKTRHAHADNVPEFPTRQNALNWTWFVSTTSALYNPRSSGMNEGASPILITRVSSMMKHAIVTKRERSDKLMQASYFYNLTETPVLAMKSTHETFGKLPSNSRLRTYGCAVYAHRYKAHRADQLDDLADTGIYARTRERLDRT